MEEIIMFVYDGSGECCFLRNVFKAPGKAVILYPGSLVRRKKTEVVSAMGLHLFFLQHELPDLTGQYFPAIRPGKTSE